MYNHFLIQNRSPFYVFCITICLCSCQALKIQKKEITALNFSLKQKDSSFIALNTQFDKLQNQVIDLNYKIEQLSAIKTNSDINNFLPLIPCPPPIPSSYLRVAEKIFSKLSTYHQADSLLTDEFAKNGYSKHFYLAIQGGGFAIATPIEEITENGTVKRSEISDNTAAGTFFKHFFSLDHFTELFFSQKGYYRTIIFLVSPNLYSFNGKKLTYNDLEQWAQVNAFRLPEIISKKKLEKQIQILALLYEFEQNENIENKVQIVDDRHCKTHFTELSLIKRFL